MPSRIDPATPQPQVRSDVAEAWAQRVDSETLAAMLSTADARTARAAKSAYYLAALREWARRYPPTEPVKV